MRQLETVNPQNAELLTAVFKINVKLLIFIF